MPVKVFWLDPEHTILTYEFYGKWTWEEIYEAFNEGHRLGRNIDYEYYVLAMTCDADAHQHIPSNIITHFPILARRISPRVALDILVLSGLTSFWHNLFHSIKSMYPRLAKRIDIVTSKEEALQMIQQHKERNAVANRQ